MFATSVNDKMQDKDDLWELGGWLVSEGLLFQYNLPNILMCPGTNADKWKQLKHNLALRQPVGHGAAVTMNIRTNLDVLHKTKMEPRWLYKFPFLLLVSEY